MRLSTSTNILFKRPNGSSATINQTLQQASKAGFKVFNLCFYDWVLPGSPFLTDRWKHWVEEIAKEKEKLHIEFGQCHAHYYNFLSDKMTSEEKDYQHMLVLRSIECCSLLGSKVCVTHPDTCTNTITPIRQSKIKNKEYFSRLLDETAKFNVSIAVENMCDYSERPCKKFCSSPEELVDFIDSINDSRLGICWDFEHAEIMEQDQRASLLLIGRHLLATHVSDTHSKTNAALMHVMPCFGDINWNKIMKTLKEIKYQGDFSFEAHNYINRLPNEVLPTALKLSYEIGNYLLSLAK